jgi:hypothetical protein
MKNGGIPFVNISYLRNKNEKITRFYPEIAAFL